MRKNANNARPNSHANLAPTAVGAMPPRRRTSRTASPTVKAKSSTDNACRSAFWPSWALIQAWMSLAYGTAAKTTTAHPEKASQRGQDRTWGEGSAWGDAGDIARGILCVPRLARATGILGWGPRVVLEEGLDAAWRALYIDSDGYPQTSLHLALALSLVSLTCGLGALCADMVEECCCMVEGSSPCTEVTGGDDAPVTPEPTSTIASGERFSVAILDASPVGTSPGASASAHNGRASRLPPAAVTPLYLSHCAFLC